MKKKRSSAESQESVLQILLLVLVLVLSPNSEGTDSERFIHQVELKKKKNPPEKEEPAAEELSVDQNRPEPEPHIDFHVFRSAEISCTSLHVHLGPHAQTERTHENVACAHFYGYWRAHVSMVTGPLATER